MDPSRRRIRAEDGRCPAAARDAWGCRIVTGAVHRVRQMISRPSVILELVQMLLTTAATGVPGIRALAGLSTALAAGRTHAPRLLPALHLDAPDIPLAQAS